MRRANIPREERTPFYLYVDEFQNFKTSTFPVILSEAAKYGLSLTMAHQHISQLDDETRQSVLGNVGTRLFFALGAPDAKFAAPYIGSHDAEKLLDFSRGEAIYSPPRTKDAQQLTTHIYEHAGPKASAGTIIEQTERRYASDVDRFGDVGPAKDNDPESGEWPTN
jgi:hypothetical protein